jgi:hypothetical protein
MMNLKINALQHIGITVTGLKRPEDFYKRLGFENAMASSFEMYGGKGFALTMQLNNIIIEIY